MHGVLLVETDVRVGDEEDVVVVLARFVWRDLRAFEAEACTPEEALAPYGEYPSCVMHWVHYESIVTSNRLTA